MSKFALMSYIKTHRLILAISLIYTVIVATVLLNRFWQYEAFYYDHGMMEGTAYQISKFQMPLHEREQGKVTIYVDHLYPSLQLVLAPFYWIWDSYETPIIVMSILIGLSVITGYEIAHTLVKNKLMVYALLLAYMFYIGMQNALIFLVHDVTLQIPFFMLLFWVIIKEKLWLYYPLLLINLGFKETISVTGVALGAAIILYKPKWFKHGIVTIVICLLYGFLASKIIIPYFRLLSYGSWGSYAYAPDFSKNLFSYLMYFFDTDMKRETIITSMTNFGFLPLFTPFSLIMLAQDFAQRFVFLNANNTLRQGLNLHYNASLAVILFVGSAIGVAYLQKYKFYRRLATYHAIFIILITAIYHRFIYHGPLGLIYNPDFFNITDNMKFMDDFIAKIPLKGKVMVQNNIAVRFTHYSNMHLLLSLDYTKKIDPDVIALDLRPGQNINNFWPMKEKDMYTLSADLLKDNRYNAVFTEPHRYIFVKKDMPIKP